MYMCISKYMLSLFVKWILFGIGQNLSSNPRFETFSSLLNSQVVVGPFKSNHLAMGPLRNFDQMQRPIALLLCCALRCENKKDNIIGTFLFEGKT